MSESPDKSRPDLHGPDPRLAPRPSMSSAALGGMVAGILGAVLLLAGLLTWSIKKAFLPWPLILLVLGLAGLVFYVLSSKERLLAFWRQKTPRLILNSAAFAVFIAGIVVLVNFVGIRHHYRHDFTKNKQYSLSEQTIKIAKALDKPVEMIAFVSPDYFAADEFKSRLREYSVLGGKITVHTYDPKVAADKVREYNIRSDGTIIIKCGDKKEDIVGGSEEQITSAILAVSKGEKTKIYFLSGHGERRVDSSSEDSIADLKKWLENQQYEIKELVLARDKEPKVPGDCAVLAIMGPEQPLLAKETEAIKGYLAQGGKAFICLAPPPAPNLADLLGPHGIKPMDGVVYDPVNNLPNAPGVTLVVQPEEHDITRGLQLFCLPLARALQVEQSAPQQPQYPGAPPPPSSQKGVPLLQTSEQSWVDTNFQPGVEPKKTPGARTGKLVLAAAVDESAKQPPPTPPGMPPQPQPPQTGPGTRIVVVGDIDFLTPRVGELARIGVVFALKSVAWLAKDEKLVSVPPKEKVERNLNLSGVQQKVVMIIVFAIPALILLAGISVYVLRRRG
jgi:hypothetical protein